MIMLQRGLGSRSWIEFSVCGLPTTNATLITMEWFSDGIVRVRSIRVNQLFFFSAASLNVPFLFGFCHEIPIWDYERPYLVFYCILLNLKERLGAIIVATDYPKGLEFTGVLCRKSHYLLEPRRVSSEFGWHGDSSRSRLCEQLFPTARYTIILIGSQQLLSRFKQHTGCNIVTSSF